MLKNQEMGFWSFEAVEQRLIEMVHLWKRTPRVGFSPSAGSPFATDAPWHLLTRLARVDGSVMDAWRIEQDDAIANAKEQPIAKRVMGLSTDEIARRDQASEWLALVPEADRRIVVLALQDLAAGRRVGWLAMRGKVGVELGAGGLARRYRLAISGIAKRLTAQRVRQAA